MYSTVCIYKLVARNGSDQKLGLSVPLLSNPGQISVEWRRTAVYSPVRKLVDEKPVHVS